MRALQRLRRGHGDVRFCADVFPVGFGDGIDRAHGRDPDHHAVPHAIRAYGIGGAD